MVARIKLAPPVFRPKSSLSSLFVSTYGGGSSTSICDPKKNIASGPFSSSIIVIRLTSGFVISTNVGSISCALYGTPGVTGPTLGV